MGKKTGQIFISCHKPSVFLEGGVFQPIKVGAMHNKKDIGQAINDNTGDNISELNPKFCELTAQYWAWKNMDLDYYGFFHYRRYLSFCLDKKFKVDDWGSVVEDYINEDSIEKYKLNQVAIDKVAKDYDIILPEKRNVRMMPEGSKNVREQYLSSGFLHEEDLNIMLDVIEEKYPEYTKYAEEYLSGRLSYLNNMFIMKKNIFRDYCDWLFDILFECEKRIDYTNYSVEAMRTPGHLAERLLNIYIAKLRDDNPGLKVMELQTVVFLNTDPIPLLEPAFAKNNIAIALSADDYYLPYIATLIGSIKFNASKKYNYDILVMHKNISDYGQKSTQRFLMDDKNFSLRFINVSSYGKKFERLFLRGHFTIETWFRLLMPEIFEKYDKILYLDSDMVANADVAELYRTNIEGFLLAACHDADTAGLYNGYEPKKKEYMDEALRLDSPYDYFQAGVILFNLAEFRREYSVKEMLRVAAERDWQLLDQDVLNVLAKNRVKYVDMSWNVMFDWRYIRRKDIISLAPKILSDEYDAAHADPKIIHYAGPDKPWNDPYADYADIFWKYARNSPFYEEIVYRMMTYRYGFVKKHSFKFFVRKHIIDRIFPYGTKRRVSAVRFYKFVQNEEK